MGSAVLGTQPSQGPGHLRKRSGTIYQTHPRSIERGETPTVRTVLSKETWIKRGLDTDLQENKGFGNTRYPLITGG